MRINASILIGLAGLVAVSLGCRVEISTAEELANETMERAADVADELGVGEVTQPSMASTPSGPTEREGGVANGVDGDLVEVSALAVGLAKAYCEAEYACVGEATRVLAGGDCVEAQAANMRATVLRSVEAAVSMGTLDYHAGEAMACLERVASLGCKVSVNRISELCAAALTTSANDSEACKSHFECPAEQFCDFSASGEVCGGRCSARGSVGQACDAVGHEACADGLLCEAGVCVSPLPTGESCEEAGTVCQLPAICALDGAGAYRCRATAEVFAAAEDMPCGAPTYCAVVNAGGEALICDPEFEICIAAPPASGACSPESFPEPCPSDQYCDPVMKLCVPRPAAGVECGLVPNKECAAGLACADRTCTPLEQMMDPCLGQ